MMATAVRTSKKDRAKDRQRRRLRVDEATKIGRLLELPKAQLRPGLFEAVDIANRSDADQRHMVRSGERRTIRRKPKIDELVVRKVINQQEAAACEWYAKAHSLRYDTTGITVRYGGVGGRSGNGFDHMPKTREQQEAYENFEYARAGINPGMLGVFERVVLYGRPLGKLAITFRTAARQLLERIEGRVNL